MTQQIQLISTFYCIYINFLYSQALRAQQKTETSLKGDTLLL